MTRDSAKHFVGYTRAGPDENGKFIYAQGGNYGPNTPDWQEGDPANATLTLPGGCDGYDRSFAATEKLINNLKIPYNSTSTNSNAYVSTALGLAGLNPNAFLQSFINQGRGASVPGWGTRLIGR